jgi:hypothetical protein
VGSISRHLRLETWVKSLGLRRTKRYFTGVAVGAAWLLSAATPAVAATSPALGVVVVGSGSVTSRPAGIACPGKCTATFATGTRVVLTPQAKNGSTFLRWSGPCTGTGACTVTVSTLTAVAAQFLAGPSTHPQPTTKYLAVPGPYYGSGIKFYVTPGGSSILNVSVPTTYLNCVPSGAINDHIGILQVAVEPNGSFSTAASQNGALSGSAVKFTYTFAGRFQTATTTTSASATGTWSESIAYASGTTASCKSNDQSWTATLFREPLQHKVLIEAGSYAGNGITFSVASGGIQNVSVPTTYLNCTPSGAVNDHITIADVAIKPDGSFTSKSSQKGVFSGSNAKFTYTFAGYFEGPTEVGAATVAGTWSETVVPTSGATTMCASNDQSWTATRS